MLWTVSALGLCGSGIEVGSGTYGKVTENLLRDIDKVRHIAHGSTETGIDTVVKGKAKDSIHVIVSLPVGSEPNESATSLTEQHL